MDLQLIYLCMLARSVDFERAREAVAADLASLAPPAPAPDAVVGVVSEVRDGERYTRTSLADGSVTEQHEGPASLTLLQFDNGPHVMKDGAWVPYVPEAADGE